MILADVSGSPARDGAQRGMAARGVEGALPLPRRARDRGSTIRRSSSASSALAIPPAWKDVWISPRPNAKLQATGVDNAGRRQYLYHPDSARSRSRRSSTSSSASRSGCPTCGRRWREHMERRAARPRAGLRGRGAADQPRLVPRRLGPLREDVADVRGHDADASGTCRCAGSGSRSASAAKHKVQVRTTVVDAELADGDQGAARPARRRAALPLRLRTASRATLTARVLNDYIRSIWARNSPPRTSAPGAAR